MSHSSLDNLAPELARIVPARLNDSGARPARASEAASRRGRGPSWQDEVRQRVRNRRRERLGDDLPLFPEPPEPMLDIELDPSSSPELPLAAPASVEPEGESGPLSFAAPSVDPVPEPESDATRRAAEHWSLGDDDEGSSSAKAPRAGVWLFDPNAAEEAPAPPALERPAPWGDRLQAAAFDIGVLAVVWGVVVYFASRAAQVSVDALEPVWPALGAYLGFLGLLYAVYFTGTCGRTIGKIVCGLKVVDVAGRPPGYGRALLRALLGTVGVLAGMLALIPVFFDPARRALHDRLLRVRVVKY